MMRHVTTRLRRTSRERRHDDDRGSVLLLTLAIVVLAGVMAVPLAGYATAMQRAGRTVNDKAQHVEAAKAGLRLALADPTSLYDVCDAAGITVGVEIATPGLDSAVETTCYKMDEVASQAEGVQRIGATTTLVGSSVPSGLFGDPYAFSGQTPADGWQADTTTTATDGKIWLPRLPVRSMNFRSPSGHLMPTGFPTCRVYFPGTYVDPVTITSNTPTYFASGTYYFTRPLRISGNANVMFGGGSYEGCTSDQEAAFYATDAPTIHNISGLGVTLVFGGEGRLVVDTATAGTSMSVRMNKRYVSATDLGTSSTVGVNIMTVNGTMVSGASQDLVIAGSLDVPRSEVQTSTVLTLESQGYTPSTLIPTTATPAPIVEVNLTDARTVLVDIPDYISIPQGTLSLSVSSAAAAANKTVEIDGGVVAAQLQVSATRPTTLSMGLINPVVQRVLQIVSVSAGSPGAVSTAVVQVNANGAYAVNSWEVQ